MKKNNIFESRKWIRRICMGLGLFMIALVLYSMVYFYFQIRESSELVESLEYQTYDKYYVMITDNRNNSFWKNVHAGAVEAAKESGAYVEMFGESLSVDYDKEDLMKIAIDSKVDGIIVEADESPSMGACIRQAQEAGIPVVTALYDHPEGLRQSYVGVGSYNLGIEYGNQICEIARNKGADRYSVLILLDSEKTDASQNILVGAVQEAIRMNMQYFNDYRISVETATIESGSMFAAEESIRDIFMQAEVLPDMIVCLNEKNTTCVYQTVVDYNKVGEVEIIGYYESDTILSAIEKNVIYSTISLDTGQMGRYCVEALNEYIQNGYVSDYYGVDVSVINARSLQSSEEGGTDEETDKADQ